MAAGGWFTWQPGGRPQTLARWGRINWRDKSPDWRDEFGFRGPRDAEVPVGGWNRLEIESAGGRVRVSLNGVRVNEARAVSPRRGHLLLQCEGSEIFFRRVDVARWPPARRADAKLPGTHDRRNRPSPNLRPWSAPAAGRGWWSGRVAAAPPR